MEVRLIKGIKIVLPAQENNIPVWISRKTQLKGKEGKEKYKEGFYNGIDKSGQVEHFSGFGAFTP
jgi:hypothetical protein